MIKDVLLSPLVLDHHDLLGSEESAEIVIEVHFLLIAFGVLTNPETLRVVLESDVYQADSEDKEDSHGGYENDRAIFKIETAELLKDDLEVHHQIIILSHTKRH